jgi:hypothetical protein
MEVGDKVVCIGSNWNTNISLLPKLYNIYTVTDYYKSERIELDYSSFLFDSKFFIPVVEYRKIKLLKLKKIINENR